jgi:hypothetical protein
LTGLILFSAGFALFCALYRGLVSLREFVLIGRRALAQPGWSPKNRQGIRLCTAH